MAKVAEQIFQANGVGDRVTVLSGWSMDVEIPEKASVYVSEIIGNEPLAERILETTLDVRKRMLLPEARSIPRRLSILAVPIEIDQDLYLLSAPAREAIERWRGDYDIDFAPLSDFVDNLFELTYVTTERAAEWKRLGEPVELARVELDSFTSLAVRGSGEGTVLHQGRCNGVLLFFSCEVSNGNVITTDPEIAGRENSWAIPIWIMAEPVDVAPGDRFSLRYSYRAPGEHDGVRIEFEDQ
jgi:hypothetical protein